MLWRRAHITNLLSGCDALVFESNLATSRYPPSLNARIASMHGHLNNDAAAGDSCSARLIEAAPSGGGAP
ncbi:MAG: hypothetical protein CBARDCOR_5699 [uncultured Caballeronia sp.]|nr:MAG: hypothetical protein CBARDCOR_5699 [uncultured Caballeronia sp.]